MLHSNTQNQQILLHCIHTNTNSETKTVLGSYLFLAGGGPSVCDGPLPFFLVPPLPTQKKKNSGIPFGFWKKSGPP